MHLTYQNEMFLVILRLILHLLVKPLISELLWKNNYYDPCAPDDKHLDNDSLRTLKINLQKCLLSSRFFLFDDFIHLFFNLFHSMVFKDTHREKAP